MRSKKTCTEGAVSVGILLANIGSPEAPTPGAVRKYLAEFLSDRRIIDWPRWLWLPVLYGIILTIRPRRSARLYQNIWNAGSPLLKTMDQLKIKLEQYFAEQGSTHIKIVVGMNYGNPSIAKGLQELRRLGVHKIMVLPLFPQYTTTTTASTYDAVFKEISSWSWQPEIHLVNHYHDHPAYILALAASVKEARVEIGELSKLLFSFHGVPKRYITESDDPYEQQCKNTAKLVAELIALPETDWQVAFQSRFGPEEWIGPHTDEILKRWGDEKQDSVHVICPGFSVDCLETLDEINREAREIFIKAGGKRLYYIPALNDHADQIALLGEIITERILHW